MENIVGVLELTRGTEEVDRMYGVDSRSAKLDSVVKLLAGVQGGMS